MITESIKRVNGYEKNPYTYYPSIIVGARASGIAAACQLKAQLGFDQLRVFGRQTGIGGTWWINRYPDVSWYISIPIFALKRKHYKFSHYTTSFMTVRKKVSPNTDTTQ